jgi:ERCC4-type nuclease
MKIVRAGNEQKPWSFPPEVEVIHKPVRTGDYTCLGLEDRLCVERKSLGDFVKTLMQDWLRFTKQMNRMAGMDVAVIAVEATVQDVVAQNYLGAADPKSVFGKCAAIQVDYGIPVLWWGSREHAQQLAYQFLRIAHGKMT